MNNNRYRKDLSDRNEWIRKRVAELLKESNLYKTEVYIKVSEELNKTYPLLWVNWETVKQIYMGYGYYKEE